MMYFKLFHKVTGTPVKVTFDDAQPGIIAIFFKKKKNRAAKGGKRPTKIRFRRVRATSNFWLKVRARVRAGGVGAPWRAPTGGANNQSRTSPPLHPHQILENNFQLSLCPYFGYSLM